MERYGLIVEKDGALFSLLQSCLRLSLVTSPVTLLTFAYITKKPWMITKEDKVRAVK